MTNRICSILAGAAALAQFAPGADVLLITDPDMSAQVNNDDVLVGILEDAGHTVTRDPGTDAFPDTSLYDLVVVSRTTNSGNYVNDAAEVASWQTIDKPMIVMAPHLFRTNRWGYQPTDTLVSDVPVPTTWSVVSPGSDLLCPLAGNAYLATGTGNEIDCAQSTIVVAGGTVVATATAGGQGMVALADIPAGTTLTSTAAGGVINTTVSRHVLFTANEYPDDAARNQLALSPNARVIFEHIVTTLTFEDADGDSMDDTWETRYFGDTSRDGTLSFDGDALTDLEEFQNCTDPTAVDTDGDGVGDDGEVDGSGNLFGSGASAPMQADSDMDGISDGDENGTLNTAFGGEATNPLDPDTDGDGMDDAYELANNTPGMALDPNDDGGVDAAQDPFGDRDGDGLANIEEYDPSQGPNLNSPRTRADLADTDGDGFSDLVEDNYFSIDPLTAWNGPDQTGTNAAVADTDGDGIPDGDERFDLGTGGYPGAGVYPTNSNPNLVDTDGDGWEDKYEADNGFNPADAADTPDQPGGFALVEDFQGEGMVIGQTYNGVNGWVAFADAAAQVVAEPIAGDGTDQVGTLRKTASGPIYKPLTAQQVILDGQTGTLFFQVYTEATAANHSMGLSDQAAPDNFPSYEAQTVLYEDATNDDVIRVRNADAFQAKGNFRLGEWMNVWIVANNADDTMMVYWETPRGETGRYELPGGPFGFRFGTQEALRTVFFMIAASAGADATLLVDNIYIDPTAENLDTPAAAKPLPAVAIAITGASRTGNSLELSFSGPAGQAGSYLVTGSQDLVAPFESGAVTIATPVAEGAAGQYTVTLDVSANGAGFFYRVELP